MEFKTTCTLLFFCLFSLTTVSQSNRPQTPKTPFNYTSEELFFINHNADSIKLAGTITLPKDIKNPPVVILISGSGPQNRNEEIMGHKPFLVLSDYLSNNGIAVLRYDDRGIGKSEGDFNSATTFDFATDVDAAIEYLKTRKDIDDAKIGLIGHSEGGLIAPIVASQNKDVAFIVSLAGTGIVGSEVILTQSWEIAKQMGAPEATLKFNDTISKMAYNVIETETDSTQIKLKIKSKLNAYKEDNASSPYAFYINDQLIDKFNSLASNKWLTTFIKTNPQDYYAKTNCPVLALNGSKDLQVLPKLNLNGIEQALKKANNKDVTIKELEGLNHLFQTSETGNPSEYIKIEETFSPIALEIIKDWILKRF
ncbi:alpha/beta hydrolase family protein [Gelatiniphilus marinus]|uniref:Alpha/beta hydrolase family protein n=1 Tax=Gelatiniphilus marinus TaxID=1759464 RepID=A0ABW5JV42_9FLAO